MSTQFSREEIDQMPQRYRATFINSLGGFKSVVLIGTKDKNGQENLSIVSSLFHIGANPPLCGLIFRPDSVDRHTLDNLLETGWYSINHIHPGIIKKAHQTSARYPKEVSEFDEVGLTPEYPEGFDVPMVKESAVKWVMKFREKHDLEINGTHMVLGEIMQVVVPTDCIKEDGFVDIVSTETTTCSGLDSYHIVKPGTRLTYAKPDTWPEEIKS